MVLEVMPYEHIVRPCDLESQGRQVLPEQLFVRKDCGIRQDESIVVSEQGIGKPGT